MANEESINSSRANLTFHSAYNEDRSLKFDCVIGSNVLHHFPLHIHDSLCIGLITKGQRNMLWVDKADIIGENDMFVINRNQPHAIDRQPHDYIAITVKGITQDVVFENIIKNDNCVDLFLQLYHIIKEKNSKYLFQHWDVLFRYLSEHHRISVTLSPKEEFIKRSLEYMKANHQNQISVEDIAQHACLSTFHFCRLFKRLTGLSPHNYLKQYRLSQSYKHLQNNTPVFDTAIETGFYDSSHFIKTFHSYMAVSPKEYQDSVREQ